MSTGGSGHIILAIIAYVAILSLWYFQNGTEHYGVAYPSIMNYPNYASFNNYPYLFNYNNYWRNNRYGNAYGYGYNGYWPSYWYQNFASYPNNLYPNYARRSIPVGY